jgi:hypothetical protein
MLHINQARVAVEKLLEFIAGRDAPTERLPGRCFRLPVSRRRARKRRRLRAQAWEDLWVDLGGEG